MHVPCRSVVIPRRSPAAARAAPQTDELQSASAAPSEESGVYVVFARLFLALVMAVALCSTLAAHHKPDHKIPSGIMKKMYGPELSLPHDVDFVCLVTTEVAGDPYSDVVYSEWLPRADAEVKADLGQSFISYHPDLNSEAGCVAF